MRTVLLCLFVILHFLFLNVSPALPKEYSEKQNRCKVENILIQYENLFYTNHSVRFSNTQVNSSHLFNNYPQVYSPPFRQKHSSRYDYKSEALNFLSASWSDIKYVYSAPARLNWKSVITLTGLSAAGIVIYANDQVIYNAFQRNKRLDWYKPVDKVTNTIEFAGLQEYLISGGVVLHFLGKTIGYEPICEMSFDLLETFLVMVPSRLAAVHLVGRERPLIGIGPYKYGLGRATSFFSGHSSTAFALAGVLSHHVNFIPFTILIHGAASSVGVQRITERRHWPSDVFVGAVVGAVMSRVVVGRADQRRINIYPSFETNNVGLGMVFRF